MHRLSVLTAVLIGLVAVRLPAQEAGRHSPFSNLGIGVKVSTLGLGVEVARPIARKANVRFGFNTFSHNQSFNTGGVNFTGALSLRSLENHLDLFPFGGSFHISPGLIVFSGNQLTANGAISEGATFTLNHVDYAAPGTVTCTGRLLTHRFAPALTFGFGNLFPRTKRFSISVEAGVAYQGTPDVQLNLAGNVAYLDANGHVVSTSIASDPSVQSNLAAQQAKWRKDVALLKFYPIISLGFAFRL